MFRIEEYITEPTRKQQIAFEYLNIAESGEPLYGGEYKDMKERLSRAFEYALDDVKHAFTDKYYGTVTKRNEDGSIYKTEPDEIIAVQYKNPALTQVTGYIKFLDKLDDKYKSDPQYKELHSLAEKWNKVGLVVKAAKESVIKGKRPPAVKSEATIFRESKEAEKKTCPCCIAKFMVKQDGTMTHHGYKRPGIGVDIGECPGAQKFKPLEESLDGSYYMIKKIEEHKKKLSEDLKQLPEREELTYTKRVRDKGTWKNVNVIVRPADGFEWSQTYNNVERTLKNRIQNAESQIDFYKDTMRNWFNKTYPKDKPECAEERGKYLKILQDYGLTGPQSKAKANGKTK